MRSAPKAWRVSMWRSRASAASAAVSPGCLAADGAKLTLADVNANKAAALAIELGADVVAADAILRVTADIVSPNALGAILTAESIAALDCKIVAGGANNQLATRADGERIHARGILYAPDYVINAGASSMSAWSISARAIALRSRLASPGSRSGSTRYGTRAPALEPRRARSRIQSRNV